ncbi:MAG TPA: immunity 22 family protein [Flavobacteriales bacterium]|nr:immunity 22 family protein [Flavobacteriales bacterium]
MKTATSHFWVGHFKTEEAFFDFFAENEEFYDNEDDSDDSYLSEFSKSQGENWYDHDFFESGFENETVTLKEKFSGYSYSNEWLPVIEQKISALNIDFNINTIAFIDKEEIGRPVSVKTTDFELVYIGEIEYRI